MGVYLVPKLAQMGYRVDVISLDKAGSDNEKLHIFKPTQRMMFT